MTLVQPLHPVARHTAPHFPRAMDPHWLFPLLSAGFGIAAALRWRRAPGWRGATGTWAWLALLFGAVALWLHLS